MNVHQPQRAVISKGTHRDRETWDRLVNSKFGGNQPILSADESAAAAKRLYRLIMGKPFKGEIRITSGNRYTWIKGGVLSVNPDKHEANSRGLRALIHDMSHYCHGRLHPKDAPHSIRQARLEGRMVTYAIRSGFLDGRLAKKSKAEPAALVVPEAKPDKVQQRYARMVTRLDKWAAELARAKRLHEKAAREVRAYERRHGERLK